ncbi:hypothetical protein COCSUDRAFT_48615 [Coccomyxa subellipsoidea C-169]|uniref:Uncharacterized protein n=1 Tax=Coccomyxa subellipsoidea (strain C-169) TaxID=574566 RepID=I0YP02_COCSC|nr:hypothetical protein COCSUDRAFT_48615 [Coccomyxa subellipsoidea C-169]EIE20121.1 hypothetical protein COCSUDRAFT_48615 [Coccomyxa subellipsoidea C-169]|eukprot:XP_005644665.1 hypothetical protein COCSUDRAFT_48615 [Coccomyxa subellipsoidea C-169]
MAFSKASLALLLLVFVSNCQRNEAQLLANIKSFLGNVPTFGSKDVPKFSTDGQRVYVSVPAPSNVNFGTVDPQTGTWAYTDKSLGAGVEVGPNGASILSRNPTQGVDDFSQAARIGPDGVVLGPDKASAEVNRAADQALGNFGVKNLKINPDGIMINDGNRLNSSVTVNNQGIQLQGNPTGGGESHLFIKPNLRVGNDQIAGAAAPAKQPSNVQISVGDGKSTATEQLQGYTNYQLDPNKGTYSQVGGNTAPPFMGLDPNGKPYTSFARAPAPGPAAARVAASAAAATQQGLLPQNAAQGAGAAPVYAPVQNQAPAPRVQLVTDKPLPRQYQYGGDLVRGTPQSANAYVQQACLAPWIIIQDLGFLLRNIMDPKVVNRDPAGPTPANNLQPQQTSNAQWQAGSNDAPVAAPAQAAAAWGDVSSDVSGSNGDVMSFQQLGMMAPAVQPEADAGSLGYAEGPMSAEQLASLDINSFKKKKKKHHPSTTPHKHSKAPSKHAELAPSGPVNPAAQTSAQQPAQTSAQQPAQSGSGQQITMTQATPSSANPAAAATKARNQAPAAAIAASFAAPTPQETAAIASRLKEVLGGSEADTVGAGGDSSFQSSGSNSSGGGPAAATPAGDGAPAAAAAVQRASDAVKQLQQSTANLGRRLLRA